HHVAVFPRSAEAAETAQRKPLRHARRIRGEIEQQRDVVARRLPGTVDWKQLLVLARERGIEQARRRFRDARLEERASRAWIHDRRSEFAEIGNRALHQIDALLIGLGEEFLVQIFTHDADAQTIEALSRSEAGIGT